MYYVSLYFNSPIFIIPLSSFFRLSTGSCFLSAYWPVCVRWGAKTELMAYRIWGCGSWLKSQSEYRGGHSVRGYSQHLVFVLLSLCLPPLNFLVWVTICFLWRIFRKSQCTDYLGFIWCACSRPHCFPSCPKIDFLKLPCCAKSVVFLFALLVFRIDSWLCTFGYPHLRAKPYYSSLPFGGGVVLVVIKLFLGILG